MPVGAALLRPAPWLIRARHALPVENLLQPNRKLDGRVEDETNLRSRAEPDPGAQQPPHPTARPIEDGKGLLLVGVVPVDRNVDPGHGEISGQLGAGHGRPPHPRVGQLEAQDAGHLAPDRLGHPLAPAFGAHELPAAGHHHATRFTKALARPPGRLVVSAPWSREPILTGQETTPDTHVTLSAGCPSRPVSHSIAASATSEG